MNTYFGQPTVTQQLTKLQFRRLFAFDELVKMDNWQDSPDISAQNKAILKTLQTNMDLAEFIDLTDDLTQHGVQFLEAVGILGAGRANEILGL